MGSGEEASLGTPEAASQRNAHVAERWRLSQETIPRRAPSLLRSWPIVRTSLGLVVRRKIVWFFFGLGAINFLYYAALVYLIAELGTEFRRRGILTGMLESLRGLSFTGEGRSYREFIFTQNVVIVLLLAFAGSVLVGNDFRFRSVAFYLSKPIGKLHYWLGKFVAVAALAATMCLLPALFLYFQFGLLNESLEFFDEHRRVFWGILGYGTLVCVTSSALLIAVASVLRKPVAIISVWVGLTVFPPIVSTILRQIGKERTGGDPWGWGLFDVWSLLRWISGMMFGIDTERYAERMPYAIPVLVAIILAALAVSWWSMRRVEVVK